MTVKSVVRFRQREASRTVRAAEQAGLTVERIELFPDGKLSFYTARRPAEQGQEKQCR